MHGIYPRHIHPGNSLVKFKHLLSSSFSLVSSFSPTRSLNLRNFLLWTSDHAIQSLHRRWIVVIRSVCFWIKLFRSMSCSRSSTGIICRSNCRCAVYMEPSKRDFNARSKFSLSFLLAL